MSLLEGIVANYLVHEFPENGLGQNRPLVEVMVRTADTTFTIHARNSAHISIGHFVKLVGAQNACQIWNEAEHQRDSAGFELWRYTQNDDYVVFCFTSDQWNDARFTVSGEMRRYFNIARIVDATRGQLWTVVPMEKQKTT
jgi:hypothetical protein